MSVAPGKHMRAFSKEPSIPSGSHRLDKTTMQKLEHIAKKVDTDLAMLPDDVVPIKAHEVPDIGESSNATGTKPETDPTFMYYAELNKQLLRTLDLAGLPRDVLTDNSTDGMNISRLTGLPCSPKQMDELMALLYCYM